MTATRHMGAPRNAAWQRASQGMGVMPPPQPGSGMRSMLAQWQMRQSTRHVNPVEGSASADSEPRPSPPPADSPPEGA